MSKFDDDYIKLCKKILSEGEEVENRTGINTVKIPSYEFHFHLDDEFPILQSKQTFHRQAIIEMLWIWQMQSNDVRELHKRGVHIWDEWMVDDDGIYRIYEPKTDVYDAEREVVVMDPLSTPISNPLGNLQPKYNDDGSVMMAKSRIEGKNIKAAKYYGKEYAYTIGTAYGYITKRYQHTQNLIRTIKEHPTDRRLVKSLWQDEFLRTAVLPSCVWGTEWDITKGRLNLSVLQRSCDVPLGLPFNVTQYATFLKMIAQVTNLEAGDINYYIKDAHIYVNQLQGIKEQINRWDKYNRLKQINHSELNRQYLNMLQQLYDLQRTPDDFKDLVYNLEQDKNMLEFIKSEEKPELWLNPDVNDFFKFDNSKELSDVKVKKYKHLGKISFPIAQ